MGEMTVTRNALKGGPFAGATVNVEGRPDKIQLGFTDAHGDQLYAVYQASPFTKMYFFKRAYRVKEPIWPAVLATTIVIACGVALLISL